MKHGFKVGDADYDIGLSRTADGYCLHLGSEHFAFQLRPAEAGGWILASGSEVDHLAIAVDGDQVHIHLDGETYQLRFEHALQRLAELNESSAADVIRSAMPGNLISLDVAVGDHVKQGQTLLMMESMKMETTIVAPRDGVVAELHVAPGQSFDKDALLLTLEAQPDD